jgi:hypothetical protein
MPCKHMNLIRIRKTGRGKVNECDVITVLDMSFMMLDWVRIVALLAAGPFVTMCGKGEVEVSLRGRCTTISLIVVLPRIYYSCQDRPKVERPLRQSCNLQ